MENPAAAARAARPAPRRILAICTRRLGDVLLTTAMLRSLRRAWPDAKIDVLTLQWSAPALLGNPDIDRVLAVPEQAGPRDSLRALGGLRGYDVALSTLASDRPHFLALLAAPVRINLTPAGPVPGAWWKRRLATQHVDIDPAAHIVVQYLRLAERLGIERHYELVPPRASAPHAALARLPRPYAVVHPAPMFRYKRWHVAGWRALLRWLAAQGLHAAVTGGPAENERRYVSELIGETGAGVTNLAGQASFPELTGLIESAAVFVGPDTSVTHLAAATGVPTVTPFGPTGAANWGPWPSGLRDDCGGSPWKQTAPLQRRGNVWIVQGLPHCVPCQREGCERHLQSRADCLDELPASRVIAAVDAALRAPRRPDPQV